MAQARFHRRRLAAISQVQSEVPDVILKIPIAAHFILESRNE